MAVFHGGAVRSACSARREAEAACRCSRHQSESASWRQAQPHDYVVSSSQLSNVQQMIHLLSQV